MVGKSFGEGMKDNTANEGQHYPAVQSCIDRARNCLKPIPQTEGREVGDSGIRIMPAQSRRVESGALQFGGDWPGVFFRGDDAGYSAMVLGQFIEIVRQSDAMHPIMLMQVESVQQRLASCVIGPAKELLTPAPVSEKGGEE
jgi:hypothetical protein